MTASTTEPDPVPAKSATLELGNAKPEQRAKRAVPRAHKRKAHGCQGRHQTAKILRLLQQPRGPHWLNGRPGAGNRIQCAAF